MGIEGMREEDGKQTEEWKTHGSVRRKNLGSQCPAALMLEPGIQGNVIRFPTLFLCSKGTHHLEARKKQLQSRHGKGSPGSLSAHKGHNSSSIGSEENGE